VHVSGGLLRCQLWLVEMLSKVLVIPDGTARIGRTDIAASVRFIVITPLLGRRLMRQRPPKPTPPPPRSQFLSDNREEGGPVCSFVLHTIIILHCVT
jgi:hypothetical protein